MAILINGNGNQAIYAAQDADLIASICGGVTSIAQVGNEFAYDLLDANTIGVQDGVILTKEGRRIQLDVDNIDEFVIPNGEQGTTSYYIIGYKLVTDAESKQTAQTFVQLMENGTDTIPEDTFRGGADEVYVSLYRVTQDGLNIDTVDILLPKLSNINGINADLMGKQSLIISDTITATTSQYGGISTDLDPSNICIVSATGTNCDGVEITTLNDKYYFVCMALGGSPTRYEPKGNTSVTVTYRYFNL